MPSTRSHITLSFQLPPPRFHMGTGRLLFPYFTHRKRSFLFLNSSLIAMVIQQKESVVFLSRASWMKIVSHDGFLSVALNLKTQVSANLSLKFRNEFAVCLYKCHILTEAVSHTSVLLFHHLLLPGGPLAAGLTLLLISFFLYFTCPPLSSSPFLPSLPSRPPLPHHSLW